MNPIDTTKDPDVGNTVISYLVANYISPNIALSSDQLAVVAVNAARDILKATITSDESLSTAKRMNFSFTMETMLVSCFFNSEECHPSDFKVRKYRQLVKVARSFLFNCVKNQVVLEQ